ncbi:MAG: hypothetical protein EHM72_03010 [Calditrichaeota bacterium]|nr:MAG: hypothetical protein EHM72_03010 [Calditrichota bacterium]
MEELFYFPTFDLLTRITYAQEANSLRYASHRSLNANEKRVVERYILQEIAPKTDYYQKSPSLLLYMGIDASLKKELKAYQVKDAIQNIIERKQEIDHKVQDLISSSLSNYYFERLGDKLLTLRNILSRTMDAYELENVLKDISILLAAYNQNSGQQINIETILPHEVMQQYQQLTNDSF